MMLFLQACAIFGPPTELDDTKGLSAERIYEKASEVLKDIYTNYKKYIDGAKKQSYRSRTEFSLDKMAEKLISIIDEKVPKQVVLKLPQLKKIELPKLKKVE
jgi:hypothetical protein